MSFPPINELVAHRPPLLLIERVVSYQPPTIRCAATLRADSPFLNGNRAPAALSLEYMAQAIATYVGLERRLAGLQPVIGFLVAARDWQMPAGELSAGDDLAVCATLAWQGGESGSFACSVERGGRTIATAQLSVFQADLARLAGDARGAS
jgi:predicted hotdog family 3-hydroxylacyl-ACP dehydratase